MTKSMLLRIIVGFLLSLLILMPDQAEAGDGCNQYCLKHRWTPRKAGTKPSTCVCYKSQDDKVGATWQEHWFEHNQLLKRVYDDNDLSLYYDDDVSRATIPWITKYVGDVWRYVKRSYGSFGNDGRLYAIFHTSKYSGGHPSYYYDSSHDNKNVIDVGPGPWLQQKGNTDIITHEIFHIVESASFNSEGSPGFGNSPNGIWGDSKMAEIFIYDVYRGLRLYSEAERFKKAVSKGTDNFPRQNTYWFRDWLLPWYMKGGGKKVLVSFFKLLSQNFPKNSGTNRYSRSLNWGEFIHFSSGSAGRNMKNQAKIAFGWSNDMEKQFNKASLDFPRVQY